MSEMDDQLQNSIKLMENGHSRGENMSDPGDTPGDLEPLIQLASQVRTLQHPSPSIEALQAREKLVMQAAREQVEQNQPRRLNLGETCYAGGQRTGRAKSTTQVEPGGHPLGRGSCAGGGSTGPLVYGGICTGCGLLAGRTTQCALGNAH
jgi:hypothetical protein